MKALTNPRWLVLGTSVLLAACATLVARLAPQRDQIKVPHERHVKADLECGACHETIFDSTSLATVDLPKEKKCLECHREEKEKGNCGFCHTRPEAPMPIQKHERTLVMNHAAHLERVKEDCRVCHKELPEPLRPEHLSPPMETCLGCHEHERHFDQGKCTQCHLDLTRYPVKPLAAFSHRGDWVKTHRLDAKANTQACATCHEQSFCADCHGQTVSQKVERLSPERVDRNFIHRADFIGRHPIEARADQALCQRCHGTSFCSECHARSGLSSPSERPLNPHQQGFGDGKAHGPQARRDITTCAACHDQGAASNCVSCHKVGGVGGNPHEPAWLLRHGHDELGRTQMCQVCHTN